MAVTDAVERYLGSDPGSERFRSAANTAVAALAAIGVAALLESVTHAFGVGASVPGAAAVNHLAFLSVLLLGSTTAVTVSFVVADLTVRARAVTSLIAASTLWAGLAIAVAIHGDRLAALVLLVVVPSAGAWFRRYGARGFAFWFPLHVGYLVGFLLGGQVGVSRLGWTAAVIGLAAVATLVVGLAFLPGHSRSTARMQRSYRARARRVLALTGALMDTPAGTRAEQRLARRLRRQVVRLNETALVLDIQFAEAQGGVGGAAAEERRRSLFEYERAVATLARLGQRLAHDRVNPETQPYARAVVTAARDLDLAALRRLACSPGRDKAADPAPRAARPGHDEVDDAEEIAERYREAARALASAVSHTGPDPRAHHEARPTDGAALPAHVRLVGGWLPGSAMVNAVASSRQGTARVDRIAMTVSSRVAVQLAVALTLAVTLGDLVSPSHLLWALIAVYVTFLGGTSDREQLSKAAFRVAGTLAGVIVGDGVAHLIGLRPVPALIVIILAVFFMGYFARINYALVVFAVTIGVTQFYAQAGELSGALLTARVEETAVGAACAVVVGLAVLPLRTAHAAELALAGYLRALAQVLDGLIAPGTPVKGHGARTDTRILDASFNAATATLRPLTRTFLGTVNRRCARVLRLVDLSHELGRTVAHDSAAVASAGSDLTQLTGVTCRAASVARTVADDLNRSPASRVVRSSPAGMDMPRRDGPTPVTGSLRSEVEDIEAALAELARMRGVAIPDVTTSEVRSP
jgi:Fusaric acid resistance protein-like